MKTNIHFKFNSFEENTDNLNLEDLGYSLIGFDSLIKKITKITNIQGDVEVYASNYRDGSVIVDAVIEIIQVIDQLPFENLSDYANLIELALEFSTEQATQLLNEVRSFYGSANEYFSKHPIDLMLIAAAITFLIKKAKSHKTEKDLLKSDLPKKVADELFHLMNKHTFNKALTPVIDDKIESIEISPNREFQRSVKINQNNFHEYLLDDDKILPHLINGKQYDLIGTITSLKSTRGDSITFCLNYKDKQYNLDLLPPEGITTKQYTKYYKEKVNLHAEIARTSFYKKPKLCLIAIDFYQGALELESLPDIGL